MKIAVQDIRYLFDVEFSYFLFLMQWHRQALRTLQTNGMSPYHYAFLLGMGFPVFW